MLSKPPGLHLKTKIDGMAMIIPLFEQASALEAGKRVTDREIDGVFARWVEYAPAQTAGDD